MFAYAGVDYEDHRIPKDDTTYPVLPPEIKTELPWGTIPVLEVDGTKIGQSRAICRYLARTFGLVGKNDLEAAKCDELVDAFNDFGAEWRLLLKEEDERKKGEIMERMKTKTIPFYLGRFNKTATENSKWLVGSNITWADIYIVSLLTLISERSGMPLTQNYEALDKLIKDVNSIPSIKKWIDTRPKTD